MAKSFFSGSFLKIVVSLSKLRASVTQADLQATVTHEDLQATLLHTDARAIALFVPPSPFVRPNENLSVLDVCVTLLAPKTTGSIFNGPLINNFMFNE